MHSFALAYWNNKPLGQLGASGGGQGIGGSRSFASRFAAALGIGAGAAGVFTILRQLKAAVVDVFNVAGQFQTQKTSFISILGQDAVNANQNVRVTADTVERLREESARLFRSSQQAAIQTALDTRQYVEVLQTALAVGRNQALTVKEIEILTKRLVLAAGAFGIEQDKIGTSVAQIFAGSARVTNQLARNLGLANDQAREAIKLAAQQGTLFQFLEQRTRSFGATAKEVENNFLNVRSAISDIFQVAGAEGIRPLFGSYPIK